MGFFGKVNNSEGWLAINIAVDGLYAVGVQRVAAGKPALALAVFQALEKSVDAPLLEKFGKQLRVSRRHCTTLLSHGQYQMLSVDAPNVPPAELKAAMRWRLKEMIDFPVDEATIDVLDVPADQASAAARNHMMFVVAARNSVIEQRQVLFSKAKIALSVIDIPDLAQRNISALIDTQGRGLAMLSFDADGGLLTVTYQGELYLSRRIDVSLAQLMAGDAPDTCFDKITLELQRSLDHFDRQYHFIVLAKLALAPMAPVSLQIHLAGNLYCPVEMLDLSSILDLSKVPDLLEIQQQQRFFFCIGAALRHEENAP